MAQEVCTLVKALEGFYIRSSEQDLAGRTDTIRLYSTDFIEFMLLPKLIRPGAGAGAEGTHCDLQHYR